MPLHTALQQPPQPERQNLSPAAAHLHAGLHTRAAALKARPSHRRQRDAPATAAAAAAIAAGGGQRLCQVGAKLLQQWLQVHSCAPPLLQQGLSTQGRAGRGEQQGGGLRWRSQQQQGVSGFHSVLRNAANPRALP